jgi:hypothetical protein
MWKGVRAVKVFSFLPWKKGKKMNGSFNCRWKGKIIDVRQPLLIA